LASLSSLYRQLSNAQEKVSEYEKEIRILEERLRDVKKVKRNLSSVVDSNTSDVNRKINKANLRLLNAINYVEKNSQLEAIFEGKEERDIGVDNNLTSCDSELVEEIRKVERDLGIAESNLVSAKNRVSSIKSSIAAEKRRQREERERRRRRRRQRAQASN